MAQASYTDARWWNAYVGIPYADRGRSHAGADCWGLVRLVYQEQFATALPSFVDDYAHSADPAVEELAAREREGWEPVQGEPAEGDVLLFRIAGRLAHVGVAIGGGQFLHAREGHAATIERLNSGSWKHRVAGAYRYRAQPGALTLAGCPHPLRSVRLEAQYPAGASLGQVVQWVREQAGTEVQSELVLMLDGKVIPAELWDSTTTVPGQRIEYRALPRGNTGRMLLMLAVVVVASIIAPHLAPVFMQMGMSMAAATAVAGAVLNLAGSLLVNAIAPIRPPKQRNPGQAERQDLLQGGSNQANPYGAIPVVLGRVRFTAPLGAQAYAEATARAGYLRMLLVWGYGPLQISDLRVGATPLETLEEVQQETLTGLDDTAEDLANFNRLYGKDVSQQYFGTELQCIERDVETATRTAGVVSVTTTTDHAYNSGQEVSLYLSGGASITGAISVAGSRVFTFASAGPDETLAASVVRMQPWTEHTITDECDSIGVALHFPEGLRRLVIDGSKAGEVEASPFRGNVQVRQLNPDTLAPLTGWGDVDKIFPGVVTNLQGAWFNTDADEELEPVYRWTRFSLDAFNKLIVRHGAFTASPGSNPTGTLLQRQQQAAFGVGVTYDRLPAYGPGEEPLWDVCLFGNTVHQTVDRRDASITGAALSISGFKATIASATVPRADAETLRYGAEGEPYHKRKDAFTVNVSFAVAKGVYQVRARRTNQSDPDFQLSSWGMKRRRYHSCQLLTITGFENRRPVIQPPGTRLAMTAMRIRASNQLNGNVDGISGTVQTICLDYDRTTSTWVQRPTRNPASLMRHVLQHPGNAQRVADSGLDLPGLVAFHDHCRTNAFMFDVVLSEQQSLLDTLRDICAAGRASPTQRDGQWTVVIDRPRSSIAQHFTPHNSWGFEGQRALPVLPHAFRVQFNNSERGYQPDEMIVYNDGYSAANATLFEGLQLPGVTTRRAIFKHARFHLAQLKLRPETYTLNADIEHLICQRGDLVRVSHDVPLWGLGSGRIRNRISSTVLELDEALPMDAGVQYTVRIRQASGASITRTVAAAALDGHYSTITLTSGVTAEQGEPGSLFLFGSLGAESVELVVQAIEPSENMTARLTLVDYSPAVYESDTEVVPAFDSQITLAPTLLQSTITAVPSISAIVSDERAMEYLGEGRYAYRISVAFTNPASLPASVSGVEGQIDYAGDTSLDWSSTTLFNTAARAVLFSDVEKGAQYRLRLRYVSDDGRTGPWTSTVLHTVSGKNLPPGPVGAVAVAVEGARLRLDWPDSAEADVVAYEVRSTDSGWGDGSRLFRGDVSTCTVVPPAAAQSATWYVRAIDATGLYSTASASASYTTAVPPNVGSITETFADTSLTNATVTLDWPDVLPAFGLRHYEVHDGTTARTVQASTITLQANWLGGRTFTVTTVDALGNRSSGQSKTITKLAPNPVTNLRAQVIDNNVLLYWTLPARTTLPVQDVLIRKGATWATAATVGAKDGGFTSLQELRSGTYTYWVAVRDTDNNLSAPVSVSAQVSEPPDFVFHGDFTSSFGGTRSSALLDAGGVLLPVNTTETFAQHFSSRGWASPQAQVSAVYPLFIQPGAGTGFYQEVFDFGTILATSQITVEYAGAVVAGVPAAGVRIETSDDNIAWAVVANDVSAFGSAFRYVRVRLTVTGSDTALYRLTSLHVRLDAKLKGDAGSVAASSADAAGTIVNFTREFVDVSSLTLSPSGTTQVTAVYDFQDAVLPATYSVAANVCTVSATGHGLVVGQRVRLAPSSGTAPLGVYTVASVPGASTFTVAMVTANTSGSLLMYPQGFRVYLFNSAGARASGTVSWAAKGY